MNSIFEMIVDNGINIFLGIIKELLECYIHDIDETDLKDKSVFIEWIAGFGWTYCYDVMLMYEESNFNNQKEIDKYLFQKFTENENDGVLALVDIISSYPKIKVELCEALQSYKNKEYRACAMIITSLIDKLFILEQKEFLQENKIIKTGMGATKAILKKIGDCNVSEIGEEFYLSLISISKFLNIFFERTNNFENDKTIINRNMLMHGMWINEITQIDCMKLFLALFNIVTTLDIYLSIKF